MGLSDIVNTAKGVVKDRGGNDALKEDATEVKENVSQDASATEKAKNTAADLKDPGASGN